MSRRWYQTLDVPGATFEDPQRKGSKFWNEGKWDNFIAPLLPLERQSFLEIGCNAGLFLSKASEAGFKRVTGVESSRQIMKQALAYRQLIGGNYTLINQAVGINFIPEDVPLADVVLLANVHYYFPVDVMAKLADTLRNRALYCIVVSARMRARTGKATHYPDEVRGYFKDWQEIDMIEGLSMEDDPAPREQMYSILFKGNLAPIGVGEWFDKWLEESKRWKHRSKGLAPAMLDFFERVLGGDEIDYEQTDLFTYWQERQPRRDGLKWLEYKAQLAKDIQENGMKEPIYIGPNGKLRDGIHRLCIAKVLGHDHILARVL